MPRGVDRVDLALAKHVFSPEAERPAYGVLPTPWGVRAFPASQVQRGLAQLEDFWAEKTSVEDDPAWAKLNQSLLAHRNPRGTSPLPATSRDALTLGSRIARLGKSLAATGFSFGYPVRSFLPQDSGYINIGQIGLAVPMLFHWLRDRPDIASLFMLHDVIPIQQPDIVDPSSVRHHKRMVKTTARFADGLIVSTRHAAHCIAEELAHFNRSNIATLTQALPLNDCFARGIAPHPALRDTEYFVVCGTIEPRKNHNLLLRVWQKLVARHGKSAPHLAMVGAPGWNADKLFSKLEQNPMLHSHVHHVAGLSTPALAQLTAGARALLVPSLAEGFSLPLLEGRALGVPVIASDIPVHRERADPGVRLLATDDCEGWLAAIDSTRLQPKRPSFPAIPIVEEASYCDAVIKFAHDRLKSKRAHEEGR